MDGSFFCCLAKTGSGAAKLVAKSRHKPRVMNRAAIRGEGCGMLSVVKVFKVG